MGRSRAAALALVVGLLLSGCVATEHDGAAVPFNAVITIPAAAPARAAAVKAVCRLPGVQDVSSVYFEEARIVDMWVHYEPVPDRWPFDEKVILAVGSAVKPYEAAAGEATLRVRILDPDQASATSPSSAFEASDSCIGKIRTV
ncbi:hypothetical protein [Arthrobacter pigmenti]